MNDNEGYPVERSDPFGMGLAAHRDQIARDECPFSAIHVEGRRWLAGWDHALFRAADNSAAIAGRIAPK